MHFVSNFLFDFVDLNLMRYNLAQEREEMIHFVYLHLVICINYVFEVDFSRIWRSKRLGPFTSREEMDFTIWIYGQNVDDDLKVVNYSFLYFVSKV